MKSVRESVLSNASSVLNTLRSKLTNDNGAPMAYHGNQVYRSTTMPWDCDSDDENDQDQNEDKENQVSPKAKNEVNRGAKPKSVQSKNSPIRSLQSVQNDLSRGTKPKIVQSERVNEKMNITMTEEEEKDHLIAQIIEKTKTLELLHNKVLNVQEEKRRLEIENRKLGKYAQKLMKKSDTFQIIEK